MRYTPRVMVALMVLLVSSATVLAADTHKTKPFEGVKANTGFATHTVVDGKDVLSLSDDFVIPEAPAPHWQVVDSEGNVHLLQQLRIKDNKTNRTIIVPGHIGDVVKVQIWCSYVEVLLGEAAFEKPMKMKRKIANPKGTH